MRRECFHFYFCWNNFLLRDFLHIPNSPFPLLTTSTFLRITADRQNSVWLDNSPYRREVETNADNSRNSKSLFLAQCFGLSSDLWWAYSRSTCRQFFFLKRMSGFFCVFLLLRYNVYMIESFGHEHHFEVTKLFENNKALKCKC